MSPLGIFGPRTGHQALFNDLCRYHDLDRKTRTLLLTIMQKFRPERPALIFVDPTWLRRAIEHEEFLESTEELRELYKNWFGA